MRLTRRTPFLACVTVVVAGMLSAAAFAGVPGDGRGDRVGHAGMKQRPEVVKYVTGRVDPGGTKGIYHRDGKPTTNGRTG